MTIEEEFTRAVKDAFEQDPEMVSVAVSINLTPEALAEYIIKNNGFEFLIYKLARKAGYEEALRLYNNNPRDGFA